jgi:hypothetical protein
MGAAKITTDHDEIRAWVEKRGGTPAHVKRTGEDEADGGILRIDFPGYAGADSLEPLGWDEWFRSFDENGLAFLHQDETDQGDESRFNKLVSRARIGSAESSSSSSVESKSGKSKSRRPSARRVRPS